MNNPIKLLISGADMGSLIASCVLRHDFHESPRQEDRFHIYRIEKDTLTVEDVLEVNLIDAGAVLHVVRHSRRRDDEVNRQRGSEGHLRSRAGSQGFQQAQSGQRCRRIIFSRVDAGVRYADARFLCLSFERTVDFRFGCFLYNVVI